MGPISRRVRRCRRDDLNHARGGCWAREPRQLARSLVTHCAKEDLPSLAANLIPFHTSLPPAPSFLIIVILEMDAESLHFYVVCTGCVC